MLFIFIKLAALINVKGNSKEDSKFRKNRCTGGIVAIEQTILIEIRFAVKCIESFS